MLRKIRCTFAGHAQWETSGQVLTMSCNTPPTIDIELPRNENILDSLVRACIRGGTKDLAAHLDGATMRPYVVLQLLKLVRSGGYPSYEDKGVNA